MEYKDYYKILGVERSADEAKIKSAYRKLARKYHPDVNKSPDAVAKFKDINEAYEVLSDREKKSRYDSLGANWQQGANFTPPPGFEGFNFNQGGFSQGFSGGGDFSDFFSSIFGDLMRGMGRGAQSSRRTSQGFNYEDLFGGAQRAQGTSQRRPHQEQPQDLDTTQDLNITAKDMMSDSAISVKMNTVEKCMKCTGNGFCSECAGTGIVSKSRTLSVKIPKGVKEGQKIRLKGEGKIDNYGRKGDLYFVIKFKDNEYSIDGEDVTKSVEITPAQAVMGCKNDVETLHGVIGIKIPAETRSGKTLRLKELGLPKKSGGFGNLNLKVLINIPETLTNEQKELYKRLSELE